jgi:hypothetical protein
MTRGYLLGVHVTAWLTTQASDVQTVLFSPESFPYMLNTQGFAIMSKMQSFASMLHYTRTEKKSASADVVKIWCR